MEHSPEVARTLNFRRNKLSTSPDHALSSVTRIGAFWARITEEHRETLLIANVDVALATID
jgi:hypothetical protein